MATKRKTPSKAKAKPRAEAAPPGPAAPEAAPAAKPDRGLMLDQVLGQVVRLMSASQRHRHLFIADLEWLVMPAMALGQARVIRDKQENPLAFACWARVSDEVEKRLKTGNPRLSPQEWRSGDSLWLIDVVTPDAALSAVLATLGKEVFKGAPVKTLLKMPKVAGPKAPKAEG